jgi:hypothetical protein
VCEERVADSRQHIPHIPQGPDRVQAGAPSIISDKLGEVALRDSQGKEKPGTEGSDPRGGDLCAGRRRCVS